MDWVETGFELPVPQTIEYKWFANGEKIPVFTIITQDIGGETITTVDFKDKKREFASIGSSEIIGLEIYPNPVIDELTVNLSDKALNIKILDLSGKTVLSIQNPDLSSPINLEGLNAGVYIVSINTAQGNIQQKILKK